MSSRYTSAFDAILEQNRRELDSLFQGSSRTGWGPNASPPPTEGAKTAPSSAGSAAAVTPDPVPASPPSPSATPSEQTLNERFGQDWRFEVTSRRRVGNEAIVVGTLTLPGAGGVRTQFGSASIAAPAAGVQGSAGGVGFSLGGAAAGRAPSPGAEESAFERAREDALANCIALL